RDPLGARDSADRESNRAKNQNNTDKQSSHPSVNKETTEYQNCEGKRGAGPIEDKVHLKRKLFMGCYTNFVGYVEDCAEQSLEAKGDTTETTIDRVKQPKARIPWILFFEQVKDTLESCGPEYHRQNDQRRAID